MTDREHEQAIFRAYEHLVHGETVEERRAGFLLMRALVFQRSPRQIERMEREKGLR